MAKFAIELVEYDVEYRAQTSMKSQVLADFLIKISPTPRSLSEAGDSGHTPEALLSS